MSKRVFLWIWACIIDVFAFLLIICLYLLSLITPQRKKKVIPGQPILLVHGLCNTGSIWIYHRWKLSKLGIGPVYTVDLRHPFQSIYVHTEILRKKALEIEKETGRKDLILIGHSMGGIVSSVYAMSSEGSNKVTDVITIGSPLAGTYTAILGPGQDAREMEFHSKFLRDLHNAFRANRTIRFYHVVSKTDLLVIPFRSAWVGGLLHQHVIFSGIGHVAMLFSSRVSHQIISWIRDR